MPNSAVPAVTPSPPPRRLLILGCSKAKTTHDGLIPAIDRYDGPAFRVLRRYLRERPDPALAVYVLSAEFGLIAADAPIPHYERLMTPARARELSRQVLDTLMHLLNDSDALLDDPKHILFVLGKNYRDALNDYIGTTSDCLLARCVAGRPGQRLAQLKSWLNAESPT